MEPKFVTEKWSCALCEEFIGGNCGDAVDKLVDVCERFKHTKKHTSTTPTTQLKNLVGAIGNGILNSPHDGKLWEALAATLRRSNAPLALFNSQFSMLTWDMLLFRGWRGNEISPVY